jgi:hypothetical protein
MNESIIQRKERKGTVTEKMNLVLFQTKAIYKTDYEAFSV